MGEVAAETRKQSLVFAVNRQRFELSDVDPSTTLLEFLRYQTPFKSVKLGCGEGGCGACIVLLSKYDPALDQVHDSTVSSCLTLLCSLNGCSITTAEGVGNSKDGFHPIQERFAGFHASQCGFCTPGMCVSLFSALVNADKTNRPEPRPGFSKLTVTEAEKAISGNLCRCTGYRPIADACKSFAADVDMEDLGFNSFWKKGESDEVKLSRLSSYNPNNASSKFPEFLKREIKAGACLASKDYRWYSPASLEQLQSLLQENEANNGNCVKIIVGNTGVGYYKELELYEKYIDLKYIPELSIIRKDQTGIEIGAAVTISKAIEALKEENLGDYHLESKTVFKKIADHMEKIASGFVRNSGSVGGNLIMAQRKHFPSDIATILLPVGTIMNITTGQKLEKLTLEEFFTRPPLDSKTILLSIKIPCWESRRDISSETDTKLLFETYRAAPRPLGNALPYLNAAFLAEVSFCRNSTGVMLNDCRLAFGAYGTKHPIKARKVEDFLTGKLLNVDVLYEAIKLLETTVIPQDGTSSPAYRSSLAVGFLYEFLSSLVHTPDEIPGGWRNGYSIAVLNGDSNSENYDKFNGIKFPTLLSSSKQVIQSSKEYHPVGQPITKAGAAIQASGEAVFVDDIPSPSNCLYGAFIYSTEPLARVRSVKFKSGSPPVGVTALISVKDIPGKNVGCTSIFGLEPLYADEHTQCAGERIAFVVADTQRHADLAANLAVIDYDKENLEPPILSVEEAVERQSFFEVPPFLNPEQVGDFSKGMAESDHQILCAEIKLGSQYYFYMETQTALAVPDEDNCMTVYSSNQCPEFAQDTIAQCLALPANNIRVITRRVGGGFGGKAIKAIPVAAACAVAAYKLQRPVRTYLNRKTDMIMAGGRHPMKITYSVGFKTSGKITGLKLDILIDAGAFADASILMPSLILGTVRRYDWGALNFNIKVCKTNLPSRSAMRAPGEVQGSFIVEAIIEHVASTLSIEVDSVRNINLHTYNSLGFFYKSIAGEPLEYTLPSIWDKLATSSDFYQRSEMIKEFNRCNKWQKRGISRVPIVHEVNVRPTPGKVSILKDGSIVVEVGGIELGQGLWTKVKQMTAYALSLIKCGGTEELLEKVRVVQSDTLSLIQGGFTGGSTTSESSCEAVRLCCNVLVERLTALKERLLEQMGSIEWEALVLQAHLTSVNLSASSLFIPEFSSTHYLNYGAAVSEVEVNLLTGETTILQTDIIYDCGQSLNPAVDLGQIEGAYVQGIGFFMLEEYPTNSDGLVTTNGTWTYKIPTMDTIPKQFNVEILSSGHHKKRVLSSKASGEPPLTLAVSVHCATRAAIAEARQQLLSWSGLDGSNSTFQLEAPATMPVVKELCGLDSIQKFLKWTMGTK
ncbi:PREDICTED: indole-3-acetaldehyde oxidase [Theobroma cacao]|uniref:indole-3-acetaldehyde oxidase n=1 Tax=Theobroma cacao TaxID=3641 RepID=A0AB32WT30_THECC|nr:PREDICTED: indole-3-acetaldehyde oxidase [Theobroma cacao]XP_017982889.1 PREDICTED: indole-3-acetaldehyde oxidase [Theobroma cacao]XP_017982890.1 PREDICTED: indole-3-acetaldehyde oxidase [Theobroma cacao]XP_017982891.1 PREDICTED: indole-3-acetaldehyde oxidase [Theobroma cacao]XP_017982892.1 PREDICTED: indole-3-acetaldehyde oxidase [Theobroma cacao]XP_017982893.1 PREDICTED: indole-3-acetaldehyde oxidase [Theobroma cacao]